MKLCYYRSFIIIYDTEVDINKLEVKIKELLILYKKDENFHIIDNCTLTRYFRSKSKGYTVEDLCIDFYHSDTLNKLTLVIKKVSQGIRDFIIYLQSSLRYPLLSLLCTNIPTPL